MSKRIEDNYAKDLCHIINSETNPIITLAIRKKICYNKPNQVGETTVKTSLKFIPNLYPNFTPKYYDVILTYEKLCEQGKFP